MMPEPTPPINIYINSDGGEVQSTICIRYNKN